MMYELSAKSTLIWLVAAYTGKRVEKCTSKVANEKLAHSLGGTLVYALMTKMFKTRDH